MRIALLPVAVLVGTLALPGCGSHGIFRDRGHDYLHAEVGKPLVYPDGLRPILAQELYPIPNIEQRRTVVAGEKPDTEIPIPPQVVTVVADAPAAAGDAAGKHVPESKVVLTSDGNGYPVLMLDLDFDWAWQVVGDALRSLATVKIDDLDRGRAVYYVVVDGKRNDAGDPWQLKLNYTANGIQAALQVDENAMAAQELSAPLMQQLKDGIVK